MSLPLGLPNPSEIREEAIRALLAVLDQAARATLLALDAEHADGWTDPDLDGEAPPDGAAWMETALAVQIEGLLRILMTHHRALRERHCLRPVRRHDF